MPAAFPIAGAETPRGFTGHEHLDGVALIHMNGRVYDPMLGRFLSADPIVQFPKSTQGLNRYTYTNNNPLSYTDPSGFFFGKIKSLFNKIERKARNVAEIVHFGPFREKAVALKNKALQNQYVQIAGYVVAGAIGNAWGVAIFAAEVAYANGAQATGALKAAAIAYATAEISFGIGEAFNAIGPSLAASAGKVVAHGVVGGVSTRLQGGSVKSGFLAGAATAALAPGVDAINGGSTGAILARTFASAVIGGVTAELGGGKFANGAISAAFQRLFNHEMHRYKDDPNGLYRYSGDEIDNIEQSNSRFDRLASCAYECTVEHYGYGDVALRGGVAALATPIPKRWLDVPILPGASHFSNPLSVFGHLIPPINYRLSTRILGTTRVFAIAGRSVPYVGGALLVYDATAISICTYSCIQGAK
jgi:RHS repeat-associated protein